MAYTQVKSSTGSAKIIVSDVKLQVRDHPIMPYEKEDRITSNGPWIWHILRNGVSMIETIISVFILLFMSIFFKWINEKQREFDKLEDKRR